MLWHGAAVPPSTCRQSAATISITACTNIAIKCVRCAHYVSAQSSRNDNVTWTHRPVLPLSGCHRGVVLQQLGSDLGGRLRGRLCVRKLSHHMHRNMHMHERKPAQRAARKEKFTAQLIGAHQIARMRAPMSLSLPTPLSQQKTRGPCRHKQHGKAKTLDCTHPYISTTSPALSLPLAYTAAYQSGDERPEVLKGRIAHPSRHIRRQFVKERKNARLPVVLTVRDQGLGAPSVGS